MAQLNIPAFRFSGGPPDEKEMKRLQNYLYTMTEQLRYTLSTLSLDDLGDLTNAIDGSMIKTGSVGDDKLYSRFLLADTAHFVYATVERLTADYLNAAQIEADYARIDELTAADGYIQSLWAGVANIESLLAGNAGTGSLQSMVINAANAVIANAVITSALVESLDIDDGTPGSGRVRVEDGALIVSDGTRTRVQLGKDANGDYNLYVADADGNILFDAAGLAAGAIKSPIITDAMIAPGADIAGSKVFLDLGEDSGTLSALFSALSADAGALSTSLTVQNGLLSLLLSQADADALSEPDGDGNAQTLFTRYSALAAAVEGLSGTVSRQETEFSEEMTVMRDAFSAFEGTADGFGLTVAKHENYLYGDGTEESVSLSSSLRFDENGLELGRPGSAVYSRFDNDSLEFFARGAASPVASIEADAGGGSMNITRATVRESLRLGNFIFEPRENGSLSIRTDNG
jgi:hypothetical protein